MGIERKAVSIADADTQAAEFVVVAIAIDGVDDIVLLPAAIRQSGPIGGREIVQVGLATGLIWLLGMMLPGNGVRETSVPERTPEDGS